MKDYKFIAGAICPACGEKDSIVLKNDDSQIRCIACNFYQNKDKSTTDTIKIINDEFHAINVTYYSTLVTFIVV